MLFLAVSKIIMGIFDVLLLFNRTRLGGYITNDPLKIKDV